MALMGKFKGAQPTVPSAPKYSELMRYERFDPLERVLEHPELMDPIPVDSYPKSKAIIRSEREQWKTPNPFYILMDIYNLPDMNVRLRK